MDGLVLGIDTSNYTTSLAVCNGQGQIVEEQRQVLSVAAGERGLRQSEALYQHIINLPHLMERLETKGSDLAGIGASVTPRPAKGSYMPVFRAGAGLARSLSASLDLPLVQVSHQEGHIRAALYGCGLEPKSMSDSFLATHFSGGTSELLLVQREKQGFSCTIVGQTLDLNAGQLIDRVGVALGLPFPSGRALEALAKSKTDGGLTFRSTVQGSDFHFSGLEQQAMAAIEAGEDSAQIARAVFRAVAKTLEKSIRCAAKTYDCRTVLFSGGVMANGVIKAVLQHRMAKGFQLYFTAPQYATDNAAGIALLAGDVLFEET